MLCILSSCPFYTKYDLPTVDHPVPPEIHHNSKFWPYFKDTLSTQAMPWMAITSTVHLLQFNGHPIKTAKAVSLKTAYWMLVWSAICFCLYWMGGVGNRC